MFRKLESLTYTGWIDGYRYAKYLEYGSKEAWNHPYKWYLSSSGGSRVPDSLHFSDLFLKDNQPAAATVTSLT